MAVLVINGPNLNLFGTREPHLYGHETLEDVERIGLEQGKLLNAHVEFFQRYLAHTAHRMPLMYCLLTAIGRAQ